MWPCGKLMYIMYNLHVTHGCKLLVKYCLQGHPSQRGFPTIFLVAEIITIDPKVTNLHLPVLTDKNVSSSKIAMNYPLLCQVFLHIYQQNLAQSINFGEKLEFFNNFYSKSLHNYNNIIIHTIPRVICLPKSNSV